MSVHLQLLLHTAKVDAVYLIIWVLVGLDAAIRCSTSAWRRGPTFIAGAYTNGPGYGDGRRAWPVLGSGRPAAILRWRPTAASRWASRQHATIGWILMVALPVAAIVAPLHPERIAAAPQRPRFSFREFWAAVARASMRRIIIADLPSPWGPGDGAALCYFFHDARASPSPTSAIC